MNLYEPVKQVLTENYVKSVGVVQLKVGGRAGWVWHYNSSHVK